MPITAPFTAYKKRFYIFLVMLLVGFSVYCIYDGYYNQTFIDEHTDVEGKMDSTLVFNRNAPPFMLAGAVAVGVWFLLRRKKNIVADEDQLIIDNKEFIAIDSIEKIDKTHFDDKGYFIITYTDGQGNPHDCRITDRHYDNLPAVLDHIVAKIS